MSNENRAPAENNISILEQNPNNTSLLERSEENRGLS